MESSCIVKSGSCGCSVVHQAFNSQLSVCSYDGLFARIPTGGAGWEHCGIHPPLPG